MTSNSQVRSQVEALLRPDLRGQSPYGAPQLDVPIALNTNENSYPVPAEVVETITATVREAASGLNRYPDREFTDLREALAAYLTRSGTTIEASQVWAGNGSNEVLLHLLQAFGGPGRVALGFTPAYSMHPIITRTTGTTWVDGMRGVPGQGRFDLSAESAVQQVREHAPHIVFLCSPNNPTGTALGLDASRPSMPPRRPSSSSTGLCRIRPSGTPSALTLLAGRPRLVVTRTMSKAFALAGARPATSPPTRRSPTLRLVRMPYHLGTQTKLSRSPH